MKTTYLCKHLSPLASLAREGFEKIVFYHGRFLWMHLAVSLTIVLIALPSFQASAQIPQPGIPQSFCIVGRDIDNMGA